MHQGDRHCSCKGSSWVFSRRRQPRTLPSPEIKTKAFPLPGAILLRPFLPPKGEEGKGSFHLYQEEACAGSPDKRVFMIKNLLLLVEGPLQRGGGNTSKGGMNPAKRRPCPTPVIGSTEEGRSSKGGQNTSRSCRQKVRTVPSYGKKTREQALHRGRPCPG